MSPTSKKHNIFVRAIAKPARTLIKCISPKKYVSIEYRYITGHKLNLQNPTRYTEKLQYLRLYEYPNNQKVTECADRERVRKYVKDKGFEDNLIKIYGVFDNFDDIDFSLLPSSFVMKCTHACAFNFICKNKNKININQLRKQFNKWLKTDYGKKTIEPHYSNIKPKIIIEELLLENNTLPIEYKIHVFNGEPKYMYVVTSRENDIHYNNYYIDWKPFNEAQFNHWTEAKDEIKKPSCWLEMVKMAQVLADDFPFVRVDLYVIHNKIYFSELTFTPAKGTLLFRDDKADFIIGEWLELNAK